MGSTGEKPPTQGQKANLVGEYMALTPNKWSDKNKYFEAKHDQLNNLRDSLQTQDDYNNAARQLIGQTGADSYQVGNARDAMEIIKGDSAAKGFSLDPDVQQGFEQMRELYMAEQAAKGLPGGVGGAGRRMPGMARPKAKAPPPEEPRKDTVSIMRRRKAKGLKKVHKGDFSTPPGKTPVAWNGGPEALKKARAIGSPMEDTPGGQAIEKFLNNENKKDMPWPEKLQIWEEASDKWSKGVAKQIGPGGQVDVATNGAIREGSVFTRIEEPNFLSGGVSPDFK